VEHPEQRERPAQVGQKSFHVLGRLAPHLSSPCPESALPPQPAERVVMGGGGNTWSLEHQKRQVRHTADTRRRVSKLQKRSTRTANSTPIGLNGSTGGADGSERRSTNKGSRQHEPERMCDLL
jgi:hypothetical protein